MAADPVSYDAITKNFNSSAYELLEKIGEGGFGSVYKAKQLTTGQIVAIKFLAISPDFDEAKKKRYIERFERETLLCSRLQHPNIVRLLDKGQGDNDLLYAVFEYVDGKTLKELLIDKGSLSAVETAAIMGQVLEALAYAHEQGITHRDIKPANIMLIQTSVRTHVKVLDFGIGTFVNEARQQDYKSITLTQETLGTPSYSAPEQLRGEPPTVKTDVYVWALVFLECLTGSPTVSGANLASVFHKQLSQSNVPLPAPVVGHPVASLLRRALQKKVHERTITSHELFTELKLLNFSNLVGDLSGQGAGGMADTTTCVSSLDQDTMENPSAAVLTGLTERKQITALAVCIQVRKVADEVLDAEVIEALHHDQKNQCTDIAVRYGATHVGTLGDTLLFYFGYPAVSDNDARLCARTALDIMSGLAKRNHLLKQNQGIVMQGRLGVHTGLVTTYADAIPEGDTPNTALELARAADADQILCSDVTRKLLEAYVQFDAASIIEAGVNALQIPTFRLTGERQVEAFGFLRGTRKNNAFVGRETELKILTGILQKSQRPQDHIPGLVHINGEAGIGKSRLVFELREKAKGYYHYVAQCLPEHQNNALYPILNLLKFKFSLDALDSTQTADLLVEVAQKLDSEHSDMVMPALPVLFAWLSIPLPEGMEPSVFAPDVQKQHLFNALSALFMYNEGHGAKKLYIFEDMHWADPTSIEFIAQFAKVIQASNDVFISTSRQPLPELLEGKGFESVDVNRLAEDASKDFISIMFNGEEIAKGVLDLLISRTDGIPLFIEELVNMMQQKELVHKLNGMIDFVSPDKLDEVPTSLRDSLQQKLDSLVYAKETAQLAATIGREFDYDLLIAASNHTESQVQNDLNELIDAELVYQQRKVDGDSYLFKHALVRDAAYDSMLGEKKQSTHKSVADAFEAEKPEYCKNNPFVIAEHFSNANEYSRAVELGLDAAKIFISQSGENYALKCLERSLLWNKGIENSAVRDENELALNSLMIPVLMVCQGYGSQEFDEIADKSKEIFDRAVSEGKSEGYKDYYFNILWGTFLFHNNRSSRDVPARIATQMKELALANNDEIQICFANVVYGFCLWNDGDFLEAKNSLELAIEEYERASFDGSEFAGRFGLDAKSWALAILSLIYWELGFLELSHHSIKKSKEWGKHVNHFGNISYTTLCHSILLFQQGNEAALIQLEKEQTEQEKKYGPQFVSSLMMVAKDWACSEVDYSIAFIDQYWGAGLRIWNSILETIVSNTLLNLDREKEALERIGKKIAWAEEYGERCYIARMYCSKAILLSRVGCRDESILLYDKALSIALEQNVYYLGLEILLLLHDECFETEAHKINDKIDMIISNLPRGHESPLLSKAKLILG